MPTSCFGRAIPSVFIRKRKRFGLMAQCCSTAATRPKNGKPISNGTVLIRDGVIVAVGSNVSIPAGAQRIDANGKIVTPGLINSLTEVGVIEIGQVRDTNDAAAKGSNNIAASFRIWDGLNPSSS